MQTHSNCFDVGGQTKWKMWPMVKKYTLYIFVYLWLKLMTFIFTYFYLHFFATFSHKHAYAIKGSA